jgi:Dyp-type peroxidase family
MASEQPLDLADIQGNVLRGYPCLDHATLLWVRVDDRAEGQAWLGEVTDRVTTEASPKPTQKARNLALGFAGLRPLGVPQKLLARFPDEFREGMEARAKRLLGDTGHNAPERWEPGLRERQGGHVLLILQAADDDLRRDLEHEARKAIDGHGLHVVHREVSDPLGPRAGIDEFKREHFGFADGFSQPVIEGTPTENGELKRGVRWSGAPLREEQTEEDWRPIKTGEFLLGHHDEDSVRPRPARFFLNGSFLVFRKLQQNVAAFRDAVADNARDFAAAGGIEAEEEVAAKIIGRQRDGTPLSRPDADRERDVKELDDFGYLDEDPRGARCPLGAHIRRTNPRDALIGGVQRTRRHRIMRRGMPYGSPLRMGDPDDGSRGLLFICFNASIGRQFETVQSWCLDGNLFDVPDEPDFLLGSGDERVTMTVQMEEPSPPRFLVRREPFVVTRGGGYYFYPSVNALKAIASDDYEGQDKDPQPPRARGGGRRRVLGRRQS